MSSSYYGTSIGNGAGGGGNGNATSTTTQSRGTYGALPAGSWNAGAAGNSAYMRTANPNELTSNNLNGLLSGNSAYMQNAARRGQEQAASRGLLNSSIAAGNSQRSAIEAGMPIAQADAQANIQAAQSNQDALNAILAEQMGNATSTENAHIGANASMYGDDLGLMNQREGRAFSGEQNGLDRAFRDYTDQRDYGYGQNNRLLDYALGSLGSSQSFNQNLGLAGITNPAFASNPAGASGYANFWSGPFTSGATSILDRFFPMGGQP